MIRRPGSISSRLKASDCPRALLFDATSILSVDNVNGELGGDLLCQLMDRPFVRVRRLGFSEAPEIECRAMAFATGNNITLVGDMTRRTVLCTLDAGVERPELRRFSFALARQPLQPRPGGLAMRAPFLRPMGIRGFGGFVLALPSHARDMSRFRYWLKLT